MAHNIASCGHVLPKGKTPDATLVKALTPDGKPIFKYLVLCPVCLKEAQRKKVVLTTKSEMDRWANSDGKGETW